MKQREHGVVRYFAFLITMLIFDNFYAGMLGLFGTASLRYLRCVVAASVCAGPDLVAALVFAIAGFTRCKGCRLLPPSPTQRADMHLIRSATLWI